MHFNEDLYGIHSSVLRYEAIVYLTMFIFRIIQRLYFVKHNEYPMSIKYNLIRH